MNPQQVTVVSVGPEGQRGCMAGRTTEEERNEVAGLQSQEAWRPWRSFKFVEGGGTPGKDQMFNQVSFEAGISVKRQAR